MLGDCQEIPKIVICPPQPRNASSQDCPQIPKQQNPPPTLPRLRLSRGPARAWTYAVSRQQAGLSSWAPPQGSSTSQVSKGNESSRYFLGFQVQTRRALVTGEDGCLQAPDHIIVLPASLAPCSLGSGHPSRASTPALPEAVFKGLGLLRSVSILPPGKRDSVKVKVNLRLGVG